MSRKTEIVEALITKLREDGLSANFTISELAKAVDIGKSTIYEYFSTKEEILVEAIRIIFTDSITSILERDVNIVGEFKPVLYEELKFIFNIALSNKFIMTIVSPEFRNSVPNELQEIFKETMRNVARHYEERFKNIFEQGIKEGIIKHENIEVNGMLIASLITGSIIRYFNSSSELLKPIAVDVYIDAVYDAILKIAN